MEGSLKVTKNISALIARTQLGQILERVKKNQDRFLITKKGEATAVILSVEDYLRNIVKQPDVLTKGPRKNNLSVYGQTIPIVADRIC